MTALVVPVTHDGTAWPARPADLPAGSICLWISAPGVGVPPGMLPGDLRTERAVDVLDQWVDYTPTLSATVTAPNLGTDGSAAGRFIEFAAGLVLAQFRFRFGTVGITSGEGTYLVSMPVPGVTDIIGAGSQDVTGSLGRVRLTSGATRTFAEARFATGGEALVLEHPNTAGTAYVIVGATVPWTWGAGHRIIGSALYQRVAL